MRTLWLTCLAAIALAAPAPGADLRRPAAFGALEPATAQAAKTQAAAWLKQAGKTDPASLAQFESIWKDDTRTVLDRVMDAFVLGDAAAAKLMSEARDPAMSAPTQVPDVLKNDKASTFFRANLALGYARALSARRIHEEGLDALKLFHPEQVVDPSGYLFHRAISEHALLLKPEATTTISRIIDDAPFSPERYKNVAVLMLLDMQTWKDKDLSAVARKMENIERRLELARGGPQTQKLQKEVVMRLDELIKELENKCKGGGQCNGGSCPNGGNPDGNPGGNNPTAPAGNPGIVTQGGPGYIDQKRLKTLVANWGSLPPREQARALQELTRGMSPRHREAIENYLRNLATGFNGTLAK
jgi:hypothetical protein